jgi:hypothetical protein
MRGVIATTTAARNSRDMQTDTDAPPDVNLASNARD